MDLKILIIGIIASFRYGDLRPYITAEISNKPQISTPNRTAGYKNI
jgi:hypothetical protein